MDPQIALFQLRELAAIVIAANDESVNSFDAVSPIELEFAMSFFALDEWLSKGGFLPYDWERGPER